MNHDFKNDSFEKNGRQEGREASSRPRMGGRVRVSRQSNYGENRSYGSEKNGGEFRRSSSYQRSERPSYQRDSYRKEGYQHDGGYQRENGYRPRTEKPQRDFNSFENHSFENREQRPRPAFGGNRYQGEGGYSNRERRPYRKPYDNNGQESGPRSFGDRPQQRIKKADPRKYSAKKVLKFKEENIDPNQPLRLNKFMANAGICSRRDADKFIQAGLVTVNGEVVTELGTKVMRTDEIKFHDQTIKIEDKVYVLLNKPKDYVTTSEDPEGRKTVMDLVKDACPERIYPIGRLDRNTTGVLLLTNDGELTSKLLHPRFLKKKIYHVYLDRNVSAADMRQILEGIELEDGEIKADAVEYANEADKKEIGIEIHSGKNRIVRRIFEHLGYRVHKLDRVYFAGLTKKNLRRGQWRFLNEDEVRMLRMGAYE